MRVRGRDWAFWVHIAMLLAIWSGVAIVVSWYLWRTHELFLYHDAWRRTLGLGIAVGAIFACYAGALTYLFFKLIANHNDDDVPLPVDPEEAALVMSPLRPWSLRAWVVAALVATAAVPAVFGYWRQLTTGLGQTGLNRPVFWGLYIINFEYFASIGYGCLLLAAILRLFRMEWRRAITRGAEIMSLAIVLAGAMNILLDLGRPDRGLKMVLWGRGESPLFWDMTAITTFLASAGVYAIVSFIPDAAYLRGRTTGWRRLLYHLCSFGFSGTAQHYDIIRGTMRFLSGIVMAVTVTVLSVVAWVFATTMQPMWHSSIFGPYYVVGALYSGVAALILVLEIVRSTMGLQTLLRPVHFRALGLVLLLLALVWGYFTASELLTVYYGDEPNEVAVLRSRFVGRFAPMNIAMLATCFVVPILALARKQTAVTVTIASLSVMIGMWLERFLTVVPTLAQPRVPVPTGTYVPNWVELSLFAATISISVLLCMLASRLVPFVSIWEVVRGRTQAAEETGRHIREYYATESTSSEPHREIS